MMAFAHFQADAFNGFQRPMPVSSRMRLQLWPNVHYFFSTNLIHTVLPGTVGGNIKGTVKKKDPLGSD
jgi:hypothetical protein